MAKIKENVKIQKKRTEDDMRKALARLVAGTATISTPVQDWDDDVVIRDCIEELLELRQERADIKGFVDTMHAKMARR